MEPGRDDVRVAGFWDFVAPDLDSFATIMESTMPPLVWVGAVAVPREVVIADAWSNPFSGIGLAARLYYAVAQTGGNQTTADAANNGQQQQIGAAPTKSITLKGTTEMAQLIIANVYRCSIRMIAGGRDIVNVVHVEGSASGQEAAAAAAVLAAWKVGSGPLSKLSSLVAMQDVTAMDLSSSSGGITVVTDTTLGGIVSTNSLATRGACALVKMNGGTRSRSTRGRLYYGPIMEADIQADGASVSSASLALFATAFTNFRTSLASAGYALGVASRVTSSFTTVSTTAVETTIATQRRRIRS
jgi:hypothetical protein